MAHASGMKLNGLNSRILADGPGIDIGIDIRFHDADLEFFFENIDQSWKSSGLARTRWRHDIQKECFLYFEFISELGSSFVVWSKYRLFYFDYSNIIHDLIIS